MIVIADDITGAAEIAGIAHAHGQQARLVCACPAASRPAVSPVYCDSVAVTTVIATVVTAAATTRRCNGAGTTAAVEETILTYRIGRDGLSKGRCGILDEELGIAATPAAVHHT